LQALRRYMRMFPRAVVSAYRNRAGGAAPIGSLGTPITLTYGRNPKSDFPAAMGRGMVPWFSIAEGGRDVLPI